MTTIDGFSGAWLQRFAFFDTYGLPSSSQQGRQALRRLPLWTRSRINFNAAAFLLGPLYFLAKGMWRKGLTLLIAALVCATFVPVLDPPEVIARAAALVVPAIAATTANYAYYLHIIMESRSWNPVEGFGRKR